MSSSCVEHIQLLPGFGARHGVPVRRIKLMGLGVLGDDCELAGSDTRVVMGCIGWKGMAGTVGTASGTHDLQYCLISCFIHIMGVYQSLEFYFQGFPVFSAKTYARWFDWFKVNSNVLLNYSVTMHIVQ